MAKLTDIYSLGGNDTGRGEREKAKREEELINEKEGNEEFGGNTVLDKYAKSMLFGSTEAWNARVAPYETVGKIQVELMRNQVKETQSTNKKLDTLIGIGSDSDSEMSSLSAVPGV